MESGVSVVWGGPGGERVGWGWVGGLGVGGWAEMQLGNEKDKRKVCLKKSL